MNAKNMFPTKVIVRFILLFFFAAQLTAQNLDVPYVPTPHDVVAAMLDVTDVAPGDYVIDLGSGDGRIVIAAAKRGAVGHGIDLNPVRVEEAEEKARKVGVQDRVVFLEGDLFDADISRATVLTMYLLSSVNLRLKPVILDQLRPGTRVVSHSFRMGNWEADEHLEIDGRHVYYWVVPANVMGNWEWESNGLKFSMDARQEYQKIDIDVNYGNSSMMVTDPLLVGERISFSAIDKNNGHSYLFSGRIEGSTISGTTQIRTGNSRSVENWSARLSRR